MSTRSRFRFRANREGKPRLAGAWSALEYFHIPDDEEEHRLLEYAERLSGSADVLVALALDLPLVWVTKRRSHSDFFGQRPVVYSSIT